MANLSNYLKEQYAAQQQQALTELKSAYDKNVQALDEQAASVPAQYEAAKNEVAVKNAIAKKNFNEQAAATGLNTGTSGQAELARSNAYMSALSKLNRSEAEAQQALERDRLALQTDYENAIAAQKAANKSALQSALYQEMIRSGSGNNTTAKYNAPNYSTEQIKRLQKAAGIDVDGIWGAQTQAAYEAGYRPSVDLTQKMMAQELGINSYGATAEEGVRKMIANGESEDRIFAYIDELTRANYLTPGENTNIKLKIRAKEL